jgi:sterol desaturase/sphingolipid hydroxylase (fatty acid hydroxylase superfamily)
MAAPRRPRVAPRKTRWAGNLLLLVSGAAIVRLLFPLAVVGVAAAARERGWGLFNIVQGEWWITFPVSVLVLDLTMYAQHVLFHRIGLLWRFHKVHHADVDLDATSGLRFHPGEILASVLIKAGVVVALGAPPLAVLLFEALLNGMSMFNHGNIYIPLRADAVLRRLIVTPDVHRVHHSVRPGETNSNYGFNLMWWDRLFGSYRPQPAAGHDRMTIGLKPFVKDTATGSVWWMLKAPFSRRGAAYSRRPSG